MSAPSTSSTDHDELVCEVEAEDDGPLTDIDTPEALAAYRRAMSDPLYRKEVLRLAADAAGAGRLPDPHGTAPPTIPPAATG